ncbi:DUF3168 domain-containing protein [Defluviimonas sp. D31]|uniref:DUF3168 domain-containing protein n=1 Tax=Defluviimonas sp. D31 TaxID=3083253 RepID=UPI00296EF080|nr:DUF3168 domain-containing protein [Defluviimonas sp. D31]MDW4550882.1 DUF3168 domain-containing protein [Defluviimonas sp. D31]
MSSMEWQFQVAIAARLGADPVLAGLGVAVYDVAPTNLEGEPERAYPCVEIGHIDARDAGTRSSEGLDLLVRINTFSATGSFREAREIQGRLFEILHRKQSEIAVAGSHLILIRRDGSEVDRDPDGIMHGVCEYRALIETE